MSDSLVGGTVDTRYDVRRLIARGGMGLVFEAYHRFTRRSVAIKVLAEHVRNMKEAQSRLLREALALTAVRHPGFVEVLDAGVCAAPKHAGESCGRAIDLLAAYVPHREADHPECDGVCVSGRCRARVQR